jgi:AmpE protein
MAFLAMIIALWLLQAWGSGGAVQRDEWFRSWQSTAGNWVQQPPWRLTFTVLVPVILAAVVLDALSDSLFGLLWIGAAAVLLLYSFGRGDFRALMDRYRSYCRSGDFEGAWMAAESEWGLVAAQDSSTSAPDAHRSIQRGLYYAGFQRLFAVLFFYLLAGPAGALAYRLLQLCRHSTEPGLTARVLHVLDWVPARLLAAVFAVTGDFVRSRDALMGALGDFGMDAGTVLQRVGNAALGSAGQVDVAPDQFAAAAASQSRETEELLKRSAGLWVAGIAIIELVRIF